MMRSLSRKQRGLVVIAMVVVAGGGFFWYYDSTRTTFHFEERYPESNRPILVPLRRLRDTNLSISFVNDTSLMCRVDVELYDSQSGSVTWYRGPNNNVALEATGRQKRVDVVLGTGASYHLYILLGENLNTTIRFGNGAVLNDTSLEAYQTGIIRIAVDEDDGLTTHGGMGISAWIPEGINGPLHVLLNIDLPTGYLGKLWTNGAPISFVERVGWGYYGDGVYATVGMMEEPWIGIGCVCTSIIARLID